MIHVPEDDQAPAVRSRKLCPTCEASPSACRSRHWLTGRACCVGCDARAGDHDQTPTCTTRSNTNTKENNR